MRMYTVGTAIKYAHGSPYFSTHGQTHFSTISVSQRTALCKPIESPVKYAFECPFKFTVNDTNDCTHGFAFNAADVVAYRRRQN